MNSPEMKALQARLSSVLKILMMNIKDIMENYKQD